MAGPCHVTDNVEGTTHNEMRPLHPPPGMETTERMNCSGQDCGDKTFRDTPTWPSQDSTSVLSAAEMEKKNRGRKNKSKSKNLFHLPCLPALKRGFRTEDSWTHGNVGAGNKAGPVGGIMDVCFQQPEGPGALDHWGLWGGRSLVLRWAPHTRMFTRLQGSQESGIASHSFQAQG